MSEITYPFMLVKGVTGVAKKHAQQSNHLVIYGLWTVKWLHD